MSDLGLASNGELLTILEKAFAGHAGSDAFIDVAELQKALGLKSPYLARRVLIALDRNGDGALSYEEFVAAAHQIVFGDEREKLWFAFRIHDENGDGFIDETEMLRMIALSMAESEIVERASQPAEYLTRVLFRAADSNGDGRISFEEFVAAVKRHPELLRQMTRSEALWFAPNEALLAWLEAPSGSRADRWRRVRNFGWAPLLLLCAWLIGNGALVLGSLLSGLGNPQRNPFYVLGHAFGLALDLNGALILLPMMRRLLTRVRASALGRVVPVDDAIAFHRLLGHTLFGFAWLHALCFTLAYLNGHSNGLAALFFGTARGLTGLALLLVFAIMWLFSLSFVRRTRRFELFYFTHLLYVAWLGLAIAHAPSFLLWVGVPLLGFGVEQALRLAKRRPATPAALSPLRSAVTQLQIQRPRGFDFAPADYVFLRIPSLARHEWHPFTVSSAPEVQHLTLHVRALGNWSSALRRLAEEPATRELQVHLDGPYGSPTAHIFRSRVAVLIGAGIGVTPFASVLESLVMRANGTSNRPSALQSAYFFWLNRDQYSFEWFASLLSRLEEHDRRGLLEVHLCMTGAGAGASALGVELARAAMHASGRSDMITGLRTHTHVGQPDWESMLGRVVSKHAPERVDVYFCGPPGLAAKLKPLCRRLGMSFREEQF